jgi:iduronate 2-sulfatase
LTLGHSKLYHPGHPLNEDQPLSWTQDAPNGTDTGIPARKNGTIADYPAYHRDSGKSSGCGYFDVCPTVDGSRDQFVDHHTATQVIATMNMAVKDERPFFLGVGMIRPHLPFIVPEVRPAHVVSSHTSS